MSTLVTDGIAAAAWFAVTATAVAAAWACTGRMFPADGFAQRIIHTTVLLWACIALVSFVIGAAGILNACTLACALLLVLAAVDPYLRSLESNDHRRKQGDSFRNGDSPQSVRMPASDWDSLVAGIWRTFWIGAVAFAGALVIVRGLLEFPDDWDTLMYHRPLIVKWLQVRSLYVPDCKLSHIPGNNELIGLWWAAPFSGDYWVGLLNIPSVLLLATASFELGRLMGLTPMFRHAAVAVTVATSVVARQLVDAENDVAVAALFTAGVAYGIRYIQGERTADLVLSGASLGLLAGVKYYALGYAAVAGLALLFTAWLHSGRRLAQKLAVTTIAMSLFTGGYWYVRNTVMTGTPIYPVGAAATYRERSAWHTSIVGNGRIEVLPEYVKSVSKTAGPCQGVAVMLLPASLAWLITGGPIAARTRSSAAALRMGLGVLLLCAFANFALTPLTIHRDDHRQLINAYLVVRFSQVPLLLSVLAGCVLLSDAYRWISRTLDQCRMVRCIMPGLIFVALAVVLLVSFLSALDQINGSALVLCLLTIDIAIAGLLLQRLTIRGCRTGRRVVVASGFVAFVSATLWLSHGWHSNFVSHYDHIYDTRVFSIIRQWDGPTPTVATTESRYYPLFGSRRQVSVWSPRSVLSKEDLFTYLNAHRAEVLVVELNNVIKRERYSGAASAVRQYPEVFEQIDSGSRIDVYRVRMDAFTQELATDDANALRKPVAQ